ncbi:uncharacterized protein LOC143039305 [Oratosquilla oratoria]|uniref:uncharacterized protein LOC143039305 n=1 Tax=Oratosquilla oratoria TaxID=337810 RepID=UPI003F763832
MASVDTRSHTKKILYGVDYIERAELPYWMIPTGKDVMQNMLYLLRPKRTGQAPYSKDAAAQLPAELVQEHWLFCILYTIHTRHIKKHILKLYSEFVTLIQARKQRQRDSFQARAADFNERMKRLMNVFCQDSEIRKKMELKHGVKMDEMEWAFLEDQRTQKKMYCEDFVDDRKWMKMMKHRSWDMQSIERMRAECEKEKEISVSFASFEDSEQSDSEDAGMDTHNTYSDVKIHISAEEGEGPSVMMRRTATDAVTQQHDELPRRYQHIRKNIRKVRPEFYETVDKLKSCYYTSEWQAESAVIMAGNKMFGRN